MRFLHLHPWKVDPKEAVAIQNRLRNRLVLQAPPFLADKPELLVAGADMAYSKSTNQIFGAVVIMRLVGAMRTSPSEVVEIQTDSGTAVFPYIPGLLSFREVPLLSRLFERARTTPDVVILDGQGTAHPRRFGLACHVGVLLDLPTIGCAKSRLCGEHRPIPKRRGASVSLLLDDEEVGAVVRSRMGVQPLYVSPGHKMDTHTAVRIVLRCCSCYRIPEPIRRAHRIVSELRGRHLH